MNFSLIDLAVDNYFLVCNLLLVVARKHDPFVPPGRVGYIARITEKFGVFEIFRQGLKVATVTIDEKLMAHFKFDNWDWGREFKKWMEKE